MKFSSHVAFPLSFFPEKYIIRAVWHTLASVNTGGVPFSVCFSYSSFFFSSDCFHLARFLQLYTNTYNHVSLRDENISVFLNNRSFCTKYLRDDINPALTLPSFLAGAYHKMRQSLNSPASSPGTLAPFPWELAVYVFAITAVSDGNVFRLTSNERSGNMFYTPTTWSLIFKFYLD